MNWKKWCIISTAIRYRQGNEKQQWLKGIKADRCYQKHDKSTKALCFFLRLLVFEDYSPSIPVYFFINYDQVTILDTGTCVYSCLILEFHIWMKAIVLYLIFISAFEKSRCYGPLKISWLRENNSTGQQGSPLRSLRRYRYLCCPILLITIFFVCKL